MTAIANIDSVFKSDALGVHSLWCTRKEDANFWFTWASGLPERPDSKMHRVASEGIGFQVAGRKC
jgi:hypothetical protein